MTANPVLELRLLGYPQVLRDGQYLAEEIGAKALGVLAFLALHVPAPVPRAKLVGTFWADKSEEAARYRLRQVLWRIRQTLGRETIESDENHCRLCLGEGGRIDAQEFRMGCRAIGIPGGHAGPDASPLPSRIGASSGELDVRALQRLVDLYHGDLLDGLQVHEAPAFDDWLLVEREALSLLHLGALWCLAKAQTAASADDAARTLARLIEVDPLRERNYRALMVVHQRQGDLASVLRVYRQCSTTLGAELGLSPSAATRKVLEMARRGAPDPLEELTRAAELLEKGRLPEARAACAAIDPFCLDPVTGGQVALLRAEIALAEGKQDESMTLMRSARQVLCRFF